LECLHGVARCSGQSSRSRRRSRHKHCLFGWPRPAGMAGGKGAPPLLPSPALPSAVLISFCQLVTTTLRRQHLAPSLAPSLACFALSLSHVRIRYAGHLRMCVPTRRRVKLAPSSSPSQSTLSLAGESIWYSARRQSDFSHVGRRAGAGGGSRSAGIRSRICLESDQGYALCVTACQWGRQPTGN
jgi:hypothetical protein